MSETLKVEQLLSAFQVAPLDLDAQLFLTDCQVRNLAAKTLTAYRYQLTAFQGFIDHRPVSAITTHDLRAYFLHLQAQVGLSTQHQAYRVLKTFFRWLQAEGVIESNPMTRLHAPRVPEQPLDPVSPETVKAMLRACEGKDLLSLRDTALLLALCDTGARATELLSVNLADADLAEGAILLRETKSKRPRAVFLGKRALKAMLRYLRGRKDATASDPLWATEDGGRLTYWGLRQVLRRRALKAGVKPPNAHAFRRLFALQALRSGLDVLSLQKMLGHADLSVINRYVKQSQEDLKRQHAEHGPVDHLLG